jgi:nucleoside-diphosphate-sugar epimerase
VQTAVVTGASGFLGRHLCRELASRGTAIIALARPGWPHTGNAYRTVVAEPLSIDVLSDILAKAHPNVVYHLAGTNRTDDLDALYRANVVYGATLLEASLRTPIRPIVVLVGSAAEYGALTAAEIPVRETQLCRPVSAYGISKLAQTHHGLAAAARGLPLVVARPFNPIGVGMPDTSALGNFVKQIAAMDSRGGILTTGPLDAVRDFIAAADVARLLVDLAEIPAAIGQVVNLCSGCGIRLEDLVRRLVELAGVPVRHEISQMRSGTSDANVVIGDPARLRSFGLAVSVPNIDALLVEMLAAARTAQG